MDHDLDVDDVDPRHESRHVPESTPPAPGILGKDDRDVRCPCRQCGGPNCGLGRSLHRLVVTVGRHGNRGDWK